MCKTALTGSAEGRRVASEFNKAILVMLVAPYAVVATGVVLVFRDRLRLRLADRLAILRSRFPASRLPWAGRGV